MIKKVTLEEFKFIVNDMSVENSLSEESLQALFKIYCDGIEWMNKEPGLPKVEISVIDSVREFIKVIKGFV